MSATMFIIPADSQDFHARGPCQRSTYSGREELLRGRSLFAKSDQSLTFFIFHTLFVCLAGSILSHNVLLIKCMIKIYTPLAYYKWVHGFTLCCYGHRFLLLFWCCCYSFTVRGGLCGVCVHQKAYSIVYHTSTLQHQHIHFLCLSKQIYYQYKNIVNTNKTYITCTVTASCYLWRLKTGMTMGVTVQMMVLVIIWLFNNSC